MQRNEGRPDVVDINRKSSVQSHFSGSAVTSWQDRYFKTDFESVIFQDRMQTALNCLRRYGDKYMSVLDVGCGAGVEALAIQSDGHAVVACDLSFEMAQLTRQRLSPSDAEHGACVLVADSEQLPLLDGIFDAVVMLGVIAYSPNPHALIGNAYRVLKPGGLLIISSVTRRALLSAISRRIPRREKRSTECNQRGRQAAAEPAVAGNKNSRAYRPSELDRLVHGFKFNKVASFGIDYGRFSYAGRKVMSDRASIALSRWLSAIAGLTPFAFLQDYARLYVGCFNKQT
jgi:ubiquinone/menaquinone biosynthesis C-methylase UbiE